MRLRALIQQLRESLGSGSFMGGGASYPGPEPGMMFSRMVTYPGLGDPAEAPTEKTPPGREREANSQRRRRPLKLLGRKKNDDAQGQGSAG